MMRLLTWNWGQAHSSKSTSFTSQVGKIRTGEDDRSTVTVFQLPSAQLSVLTKPVRTNSQLKSMRQKHIMSLGTGRKSHSCRFLSIGQQGIQEINSNTNNPFYHFSSRRKISPWMCSRVGHVCITTLISKGCQGWSGKGRQREVGNIQYIHGSGLILCCQKKAIGGSVRPEPPQILDQVRSSPSFLPTHPKHGILRLPQKIKPNSSPKRIIQGHYSRSVAFQKKSKGP